MGTWRKNQLPPHLLAVTLTREFRPLPAFHRQVNMLRSQPALRSFAATADSSHRRTGKVRDNAGFRCGRANGGFEKMGASATLFREKYRRAL